MYPSTGYVTCILDDAKVYTNHAKKKIIDLDDVKLASQLVLDKSFTSPPPRDVLLELARGRNIAPLPLIKSHCGLRLPPDRYCLVAANYKLKAAAQPKKMIKSALSLDKSIINDKQTIKTQIKTSAAAVTQMPMLKRQTITTVPKTQTVTIPKPVFKFTTTSTSASSGSSGGGGGGGGGNSGGMTMNKQQSSMMKMKSEIKTENENEEQMSSTAIKRRREDDDFQMMD